MTNRRRFLRSLAVAPAAVPIVLVAMSRAAPAAAADDADELLSLATLIMAGLISVNHARARLNLAPLEGGNFVLRYAAGKGPVEMNWPVAGVLRKNALPRAEQ
jgi:hypothetical protein